MRCLLSGTLGSFTHYRASPKGGFQIEQLNIEGKRSGDGFVAHKALLVNALSRALADRVMVMDFTIGRRGLIGYIKALSGSNVVKVIPLNGSASASQANGDKRLKVICGANVSYLEDGLWTDENTPMTICEVRVSRHNVVKPNIGTTELAEALLRVLPFTAKEDNRPVLQYVKVIAKEGKLTLVSADGFRLAVVNLDLDDVEGEALILRDDLKGVAGALKSARRARISFEGENVNTPSSLIIDTELIRYKWVSGDGKFPEWEKLIPSESSILAHLDTLEAIKAVSSLKALSTEKAYPVDLTIGDGKLVMSSPDDRGQAELAVDTDGEGFIRVDGAYLAEALRACGGMAELKLVNAYSPMLFSTNGYRLVVMPMLTTEATEQQKAEVKANAETEPAETEPTETEPQNKAKKAKGKKTSKPEPQPVSA